MTNNKSLIRKDLSYETPSVNVLDIQSEGMLCASGDFDAQDWQTGQTNWFE